MNRRQLLASLLAVPLAGLTPSARKPDLFTRLEALERRTFAAAAGTRGPYLDFDPGTPAMLHGRELVTRYPKFSPEKFREFQASIDEAVRKLNALLKTLPQTEYALLNVVTPTYK